MTDTRVTPSEIEPEALAGEANAAATSGSLNVTVGKFTLAVTIPTGESTTYTFLLTEAGTPATTLADFSFTDSEHFSVQVQMPTFGTGDSAISAGFTLKEGSS